MAENIRILVIDDEEVILQGVQKILQNDQKYHYSITTTLSGEEGLALAQASNYDIIYLVMPGMDGMEVLEQLVNLRITAKIIMFTGFATMQAALKAMRIGAVDFISKPFTKVEMCKSISKALQVVQLNTAPGGMESVMDMPVLSHVLRPGVVHKFPSKILARMDDDQKITIGIANELLSGIGIIKEINLVVVGKLIVLGKEFCKLTDCDDNMHILTAPFSGKVIEHNHRVLKAPSLLHDKFLDTGWLMRVELFEPDGRVSGTRQ